MAEEHELVDRSSPTDAAHASEQEATGLNAVVETQQESQTPSIASDIHGNPVEERIESDTAALLMSHGTRNDEATPQSTDPEENHGFESSETNALQARNERPHALAAWWLEILACIISTSALIATFATLFAYADQPSPDWPTWLSLNALIAIYIVLLKSGVLLIAAEGIGQLKWSWFAESPRSLLDMVKYDDATRGPVGASVLIWKLKGGQLVASLGSLVTILALIVDPFTQQIIRYYDCSIPVDGVAQIPRTNYFQGFGGYHLSPLEYSMSPGIQSAVNQGVFNPSRSPWSECTTGNCTWDSEYSTLGWCSSCREITTQLTIQNITYEHVNYGGSEETIWNVTTRIPDGVEGGYCKPPYCDFQYAAMGASPDYLDDPVLGHIISLDFMRAWTPSIGSSESVDPSTNEPFPECVDKPDNSSWNCKGYGAARCTFMPCVKTYKARVDIGKFEETLVDTASVWGKQEGNIHMTLDNRNILSTLDLKCTTQEEKEHLRRLGYHFDQDQRWIAYNRTFNLTTWPTVSDEFPQSMTLRNCYYGIDWTYLQNLATWLGGNFNGTITGPMLMSMMPLGNFEGPQNIQMIWNFGDVTFERVEQSFENISNSITNYIRENGVANFSNPAIGTAHHYKTCIEVRWPWLTYSAVLVLLALVFLIWTLVETKQRKTSSQPPIWKSSPLALLYHGLHPDDKIREATHILTHASPNTVKEMEHLAGSTAVQLREVDLPDGLHLRLQIAVAAPKH